jgi:hypothetical protein
MDKETLEAEEFEAIMKGEPIEEKPEENTGE